MTGSFSPMGPALRYRLLLVGLEASRHAAGGELDAADEALRIDQLDREWSAMSAEERDEFEASLVRHIAREWRRGRSVRLPPPPPLPRLPRRLDWRRVALVASWVVSVAGAFMAGAFMAGAVAAGRLP